MRSATSILIAILGLALLMVVHEAGHFFAARRYGMRVVKFSIGFGPTLWRRKPAASPTTYQIAIIPFMAYVQIAGMNPYEEIEPDDKGSYANASLWARVVTIFAGPLVNYLFASVLMFAGLMVGRTITDDQSMKITVLDDGPAKVAGMHTGDKVLAVQGESISDWDNLRRAISKHPGEKITVSVQRAGETFGIDVVPGPKGDKYEGRIRIGPEHRPVGVAEAAKLSATKRTTAATTF